MTNKIDLCRLIQEHQLFLWNAKEYSQPLYDATYYKNCIAMNLFVLTGYKFHMDILDFSLEAL